MNLSNQFNLSFINLKMIIYKKVSHFEWNNHSINQRIINQSSIKIQTHIDLEHITYKTVFSQIKVNHSNVNFYIRNDSLKIPWTWIQLTLLSSRESKTLTLLSSRASTKLTLLSSGTWIAQFPTEELSSPSPS